MIVIFLYAVYKVFLLHSMFFDKPIVSSSKIQNITVFMNECLCWTYILGMLKELLIYMSVTFTYYVLCQTALTSTQSFIWEGRIFM